MAKGEKLFKKQETQTINKNLKNLGGVQTRLHFSIIASLLGEKDLTGVY
jgi:hypothetical protein